MHIRDIASLQAAIQAGLPAKYVLFWGHTLATVDEVDKSCFSQWFPASFTVASVEYATAEHFMMVQKARLFGDVEMVPRIVGAGSPGEAKQLGRNVRGFDAAVWDAARLDIVIEGNVAKFGQNAALRDYLLATGERVLVEASPLDRIWGIGMSAKNPAALDPAQWRGLNLLGFALMAARQRLREA